MGPPTNQAKKVLLTSREKKRRRSSALRARTKRTNVTVANALSTAELETQLERDGVLGANILVDLIARVKPAGKDCVSAMHAVRRGLAFLATPSKNDHELSAWLEQRHTDLYAALADVINDDSSTETQAESALAICALAGGTAWTQASRAALNNDSRTAVLGDCFVSRFGNLREIALEQLTCAAKSIPPARAIALLQHCIAPPSKNCVTSAKAPKPRQLRAAHGAAWLSVLARDMDATTLATALRRLPTDVLPNVTEPLNFADLLTNCYNNANNVDIAIAALDALFVLISKHGLDYPRFYHKLYALFTPYVLFHSEHNDRFLELSSKFLRFGEFLPGSIIAAFIKRLVRRSLVAPPSGAMWCLRLALDLLHKHPNVSFLVNRSISLFDNVPSKENAKTHVLKYKGADPFDDDQIDPQDSRADESCLWELEPLRNHISPPVSRLVLAFSKDVRKKPLPPHGDVSDYAALTFADVFEAEYKRRSKSTTVAYDAPGSAPGVKEVVDDISSSLVWR